MVRSHFDRNTGRETSMTLFSSSSSFCEGTITNSQGTRIGFFVLSSLQEYQIQASAGYFKVQTRIPSSLTNPRMVFAEVRGVWNASLMQNIKLVPIQRRENQKEKCSWGGRRLKFRPPSSLVTEHRPQLHIIYTKDHRKIFCK